MVNNSQSLMNKKSKIADDLDIDLDEIEGSLNQLQNYSNDTSNKKSEGQRKTDFFEGGEQEGQTLSIEEILKQAFTLVFKDEFVTFPNAVLNVFKNKVHESMSSRDFLRCKNDHNVLRLKNAIYYSLKLAFHMGNSKMFMGDMDACEDKELEVRATLDFNLSMLVNDLYVLLFCTG